MDHIAQEAAALQGDLVTYRRYLHQNPELGFDLPVTRAFVADILKKYGYEPEYIGKSGISVIAGSGEGKTFLIRGDMDALPMREMTDLPFASCNGKMHACGHDFHTSALLGAARLLKKHESEICGRVKLMFQPAEEIMDGAADMVSSGILKNPDVDAALALHVVHAPLGSAGYTPGLACGSSDVFTITVKGKGGHGAAPHRNIDPVNAASHIVIALQEINSREVNPNELIVLTVCSVHAGTAPNVMPESAVLQGTIRTMNMDVKAFARKRLVEIAQGICHTFRADCCVDFVNDGIPPMLNNMELADSVAGYIDDMFGKKTAYHIERMTGSEDFSVLSQLIPSALFWIGTGSDEEGYFYGVHDNRVIFNEEALHIMAAIYTGAALRWLSENR